jgi:uncharacterized protein (DUF2147 family)
LLAIVHVFTGLVFYFANIASIYADSLSPIGLWKTVDDETGEVKSLVRIMNQDGALIGKIEKLFPKPGKDPNPLCKKCEADKKDKPLLGMEILWNLTRSGDEWSGGYIFDPNNGKTYKCTIKLDGEGTKLIVRGYIGFSLLGRSQTWNRAVQ